MTRKQGPPETSPRRPGGAQRSAAAMHEGKRAAAIARFEQYRHLTRDLGWQRYRARQEMGISAPTVERYERELRKTDPPAQPRRVGPARQAKSSTTPPSQDREEDHMAHHKAQALKRTVGVEWMAGSACGEWDLEWFFGPDGERQADREVREAYAAGICYGCSVIKDCFEYAMERRESGVWGGSTDDERKSERRKRLRQRATAA